MIYSTIPIKTGYIQPNEGYYKIIDNVINKCKDNDYLIISETPISIAQNNLIDESKYKPGILSIILTEIWAKYLWGYIFGPLFHFKKRTIYNLKHMPPEARYHKQAILENYGIKYALQPDAEAGVDLSNVPEQYSSKLPENPDKIVQDIQEIIKNKTNKIIHVLIIDTDPTYQYKGKLFTSLPVATNKIKHDTGISGYVLSRFSKKIGPTIIATTNKTEDIYKLINLARLAEKCQKDNSEIEFETVYNMQTKFNENINEITSDMLNKITHIPAILIRKN